MVYDVIDETTCRIWFDARMGAPNAPVKQLVSMMIIKELFRWSDSQLFEQFEFNVLVHRAIGIDTLTEDIPVPSTYYLFRKRIYEHGKETGEELLEETFSQITEAQVREFKVDGRRIRMDSKLLGSVYELHKAETYQDSGEARYYIRTTSGRKYFSSLAIYTALQRQKLISRPERELQIRNNVKATIGHFAYGLLNHKTPYRRKQKQQMWADCRAMVVNIKRIAGYVRSKRPFEEPKFE